MLLSDIECDPDLRVLVDIYGSSHRSQVLERTSSSDFRKFFKHFGQGFPQHHIDALVSASSV